MSASVHRPAGQHLLADFHGIAASVLRDAAGLEKLLTEAALQAGARVLFSRFHVFGEGGGVTGVVLLAESHISIHTWPEEGFAAADVFMCGDARPEKALDAMRVALKPGRCEMRSIARGDAPALSLAASAG